LRADTPSLKSLCISPTGDQQKRFIFEAHFILKSFFRVARAVDHAATLKNARNG